MNKKIFQSSRPVFKNPDKPEPMGGAEHRIKVPEVKIVVTEKELAEQRERKEKLLNEYERRRKNLLAVIDRFKKKDDPDLRLKAMQYEQRVMNETLDPSVLKAMRGVTEEEVKGYINKLLEISGSTVERDEKLAAWLEAREEEKVYDLVQRYNLMREVNIAMMKELKNYFGNGVLYEDILNNLTQGFPRLSPTEVKDRRSVTAAIEELKASMDKVKPQIDAARSFRHKVYETAFYHAVGRVHDRYLSSLETNPAAFEKQVHDMVNRMSEVDLSKVEAGDTWSVTYQGLTFAINRGGRGMNVKMTGASEENLKRYSKLAEFLKPKGARGKKKRTARVEVEGRKFETEL